MDFLIKPYGGAGIINLGMTREDLSRLSLGPVKSFKRVPTQSIPSDHYLDVGLVISYKSSGIVEAIELSRPANPILNGFELFELSVQEIKDLLLLEDANLIVEADGYISKKLGISIYIIGLEDEGSDAKVQSIFVFEKGYYD